MHKVARSIFYAIPIPFIVLWLLYIFQIKKRAPNKREYIILDDIDRQLLLNEELDAQEIKTRSKNIIKRTRSNVNISSTILTKEAIELKRRFMQDLYNRLSHFYTNLNQNILRAEDPLHHKLSGGSLLRFYKEQKLEILHLIKTLDKALKDDNIGHFTFEEEIIIEEDPNSFNEFSKYGIDVAIVK